MLLAVDVGNTQTVLGVFDQKKLLCDFRISTDRDKTADELAITLADLLRLQELKLQDIKALIVSSVVPSHTSALTTMARDHLNISPLIVGPGVKTGMPILYENPHEVGADRIVNGVAAFTLYGGPAIVVDFGTATTFDVISEKGEYLGGAIAPGVQISADALFTVAAKLSRVDIVRPKAVIGKNTAESLQSGILFGYAGQVDAMVNRITEELGKKPVVIATGGLAELVHPECRTIEKLDLLLTLKGLQMIFEKNA
jgi:type III pantothenate kinase